MPDARPVTRLTLWHLTIAASGFAGVWLASRQYDVWWTALSQQGSLAVGVAYLGFAACPCLATGRLQTTTSWLRGALATLMVLIATAFAVMQHGNGFDAYSIFEHLVTPALVVTDYLIVGSNRVEPRWWHVPSWLLPPTSYLVYYVAADLNVYADLDPSQPTSFTANLALLLGLLLLAGLGLSAAVGTLQPSARSPLGSVHDPVAAASGAPVSLTASAQDRYAGAPFVTSSRPETSMHVPAADGNLRSSSGRTPGDLSDQARRLT